MDLTQLANLGEFIGGIAVLVTLIYLAIQVRQANLNSRIEGNQQLGRDYNRHQSAMMEEQNLDAFLKGLSSYWDLRPEERFRFDTCVTGFVNLIEATLQHTRAGRLDQELAMQQDYLGTRLFAYPGMREWWQHSQRGGFGASTIQWVDEQIERNRETPRFWEATRPTLGGRSAP